MTTVNLRGAFTSRSWHERDIALLTFPRALSPLPRRQLHRNLLDDLDIESLKRRHAPRMIGQQPNALQIQIRQNLRPQPNLALRLALAVRQRRQPPLPMKCQERLLANLLSRKSA